MILVSGMATVDSVVDALRLGALDYLRKPLDIARLKAALALVFSQRLQQERRHQPVILPDAGIGRLTGVSSAMQEVYRLMRKVAPTDATVFITGESGTGKELVAHAICELSNRRHAPFIPLNCGAIPAHLIESELFGHERGSFTGATQLRHGCFERATGGTLFLDEIVEMPMDLQVKLLRVLESGAVVRVGGDRPVRTDVRLIAACNRAPEVAVKEGRLREDLYYRISVFPIALPPLRDREGDALVLADEFVASLNASNGTSKRLSPGARRQIHDHAWRGNVRELKNVLQRAFILSESVMDLAELSAGRDSEPSTLGRTLRQSERSHILATLERCHGDKRRAAQILGVSLTTLYTRLQRYAG